MVVLAGLMIGAFDTESGLTVTDLPLGNYFIVADGQDIGSDRFEIEVKEE